MRQIDRLLYDHDECYFSLNGSVLYILLTSVLLHDIGKGVKDKPENRGLLYNHADASFDIISKNWGTLGIPTEKIANIIAKICRFHDSSDLLKMEELYTEYYIDQFKRREPIRGRLLGALLFLGDHMDNTFTRIVPDFFKEGAPLKEVGRFRRKIADVRLDRQYKLIKEIVDKSSLYQKDLQGNIILRGDLPAYLSKRIKDDNGKSATESVLYTVANDVMTNERKIALVRDELNIMGIPVKKWLIECDEHLISVYEEKDRYTSEKPVINSVYALEPIINLDYCLEVLKGICSLSGGIFARQFFQYSELVNFIREEERKTYKVKCAVRRLSLLLKAGNVFDYVIYYDENNWSFYCQKNERPVNSQDQKDAVYEEVKKIIKERLDKHHA